MPLLGQLKFDRLWPRLRSLHLRGISSLVIDWDLPELHELDLRRTDLRGANLEALTRLPLLATLVLDDTQLRGDDLRVLARMQSLTRLSLGRNHAVNDAALAPLQALVGLRHLSLLGTRVTDKSVETLRRLPVLESLDLSWTPVCEPALDTLGRLKTLDLSGCNIDVLKLPPRLERLNLRSAKIRDQETIVEAGSLRQLDLTAAEVTWELLLAPVLETLWVWIWPVDHSDADMRGRAARCFPGVKVLSCMFDTHLY